jgi:hypothetical protein
MLRMYFVQQWYGLNDETVEDVIYNAQALRHFILNLTPVAYPRLQAGA